MKLPILACASTLLLGACSTMYRPLALDAKTGMYPTTVQVDAGATTTFDTSHDVRSYKYVLLLADSTMRPSVFAFTVRQALAQAGVTRVYTGAEFLALAQDRGIPSPGMQPIPVLVARVSKELGPVLVIDYAYRYVGDAHFYSHLAAYDGATGLPLLAVNQPRTNWSDADTEAMYPVLNVLRKWMLESAKGRA